MSAMARLSERRAARPSSASTPAPSQPPPGTPGTPGTLGRPGPPTTPAPGQQQLAGLASLEAPAARAALESPPPGRGQRASREPLSFQAPASPASGGRTAGPSVSASKFGPPPTAAGRTAGGVEFGVPAGNAPRDNATLTLQFQNLEREVSELRESVAHEQLERERLTAKVHTSKGAVGENTMGTLSIAMAELQEAAKADRAVLHELEHHLSEERNARVTVEDDMDSHIEKLEEQEQKSQRDVFDLQKEIEHVGTELTAMYAELTSLQQQVVTQLRGECDDAVRKVDAQYSGVLAESAALAEQSKQVVPRVSRLEERVAASEDDQHDQIAELKRIVAQQQKDFDARLTRMENETREVLAGQEKRHAEALAAVVAEQENHSTAIHQCLDMLEQVASNDALKQTEERLGMAIDRVGKATEANHAELAELTDGLVECNAAILAADSLASDAGARIEQLGQERAVWEQTAETAMDEMEAELQDKIATVENETHEFEDMVRRKLVRLTARSSMLCVSG